MASEQESSVERVLLLEAELERGQLVSNRAGTTALFSTRCPTRERPNEDAAALFHVDGQLILAISDGAGGTRGGAIASRTVLEELGESVARVSDGVTARAAILDGIERANQSLLERGAGSCATLAVACIEGDRLRCFLVGDSVILVTGQRGKLHFQSTMHSPVGYALEAGLLDEEEAIQHEERHFVSNLVGTSDMSIEISPELCLQSRDTVVIGSDGLFDNLRVDEIVDVFRKGRLELAMNRAITRSLERMKGLDEAAPSKADDLSILAFRRRA